MSCYENFLAGVPTTNPTAAIPNLLETIQAIQYSTPSTSASTSTSISPTMTMPFFQPAITPPLDPAISLLLRQLNLTSPTLSVDQISLAALAASETEKMRRRSLSEQSTSTLDHIEAARRRFSESLLTNYDPARWLSQLLPTFPALQMPPPSPVDPTPNLTLSGTIQPTDLSPAPASKKPPRKQRTIYGVKQTEVLEEAFNSQKYMVGVEREMLARDLGLSEAQVRVWFQNRRSKFRKVHVPKEN
ncbi:unnamed protein product [Caenorhabditis bovis]|uniref:Homeobox domain-containing protein n=1 Tax=Caenorhabditis bovis TaxID=2654633 RepID=A0A8S1EQE8_9PELO|nr:unnamed protein product [Caenorhabditis bovis]